VPELDLGLGPDRDVLGDRIEPLLHARVELDIAPERHELLAVDAHALGLRFLVHEVHVGDEAVRLMLARKAPDLGPEAFRVLADLRQERVLLHGLGRERAIEVVDERDRSLLEARTLDPLLPVRLFPHTHAGAPSVVAAASLD
jgi:hypothetical protein